MAAAWLAPVFAQGQVSAPRPTTPVEPAIVTPSALLGVSSSSLLPGQNPSSAQNAYYGSVTVGTATDEVLKLSLDDAVQRGIANNLAIVSARVAQEQAHATSLQDLQRLLPTIMAQGTTGEHQFNLATFGFNQRLISQFSQILPGLNPSQVKEIVKVDVTQAEATYQQTFFDLPSIDRYRASKHLAKAAYFSTQSSRGLVVQNVGDAYLQAIADGTQVDSDKSLLRADELLLKQAVAQHDAGVIAGIDLLRARVQYQQQQQKVIADTNTYEKQLILVKREIGVPLAQKIALTDAAPFAELETMSLDDAKRLAFESRQDYQGMQEQVKAANLNRKAARFERLPTVSADGNYGITGVTHGSYHGTFLAEGTVSIPVFKEAELRGDAQVATASLNSLRQQLADLRVQIVQQLQDSMLDIQSAAQLAHVAQSNVSLATTELQQANDRFAAGVEDNLAVVQAQATLSGAQTSLISDTLQYNEAKLGLARNLGIIDTQYQRYLGSQ